LLNEDDETNKKPLLPIKTKDGILRRYTIKKDEIGNCQYLYFIIISSKISKTISYVVLK